ncbi:bifunctional [glutamate--ammonia ligase]-adenylyl-L-tyrosine phosphorylase/[glutamate--ammonia-ligase] adenylyltransferase [Marinobacterium jannaschii]|uniref:bifunctional [glutamate--ammonia ligase]-adenylyl-L-tyrosine phosphorylase/[glutamate--ammonia-ligase] adenylyltransferase n=1 Tax=Marinobacterium jannaschii TaxID=64970 RepID=UPI00055C9AEB|nr:bifunctional [glutamate--ammonia ligase]-adenylyl-L-tyrosine phosphorylase/[glutamate--ammonia-ligase] adenylyltransferase [Marinobacterium jannaschii]
MSNALSTPPAGIELPAELTPLLARNWAQITEKLSATTAPDTSVLHDLARVLVGSDFVAEQLSRSPDMLRSLLESGDLYRGYADDAYSRALKQRLTDVTEESDLHRQLRQFRQREQVRIIWRDLTRSAEMEQTTWELSRLADACIDQTLSWLYADACKRWGVPHSRNGKPQQMVVLGMGKLGANELNLSSDIDLIFTFPENGETDGERKSLENQEFFIRLGKKLIQALDNATFDGFVFRVDMRLRPFGTAGPLAASFAALEGYYQDQGRDWERYAMIKARVVAGDQRAGAELLDMLRPFVYRKYIDFSAFDSLRDMKQMINSEVRRKGLQQNVKLGAGGIREVEFIAQAFQLIRGGRDNRLQQRELRNILPLLPDAVGMPPQAVDELHAAYRFLRNAEHAIQAIADRQTQELPRDERDQARLAYSMGCADWEQFSAQLQQHRDAVSRHFADVIAPAEEVDDNAESCDRTDWLLLWNGTFDEEQALEFLQAQGYDDPVASLRELNTLYNTRTVQMLQQIAQERLHAVLPNLLEQVALVDNSSATLSRVLVLIQAVLRRSAYLVLLAENPGALQQLVRLCSGSSWFSEQLSKQPILLDELIDQRSLYRPVDKQQLQNELRQQLLRIPEEDTEQLMEALRYFKGAQVLKVAASDITGVLPLMKVSDYLTWTAEVILEAVLDIAWRNMTEKYGVPLRAAGEPCNPDFIVLGYGKVGGIELSYGSDLDLVFIHDADPNLFTEGEKSIANSVFFTRLGQRIIHILNTFTPSGQLYEVDMRLRPSGNSGLLVSSLKAFRDYQLKEAWTWEHQALVRARVVAGDPRLAERYSAVRHEILSAARDRQELTKEVVDMREKMRAHLGSKKTENTENPVFHLKQDKGGIVDIEFLVQFCALNWAGQHPALIEFTDNIRILDAAENAGLMPAGDAEILREAYKAYRSVGHRLTLQNQSGVIGDDEMSDYRVEVSRIWSFLMGD